MTELALEDAERMLDPVPDHRDDAVDPLVEGMQRAALRRLSHDTPDLAQTLPRPLTLPRARR